MQKSPYDHLCHNHRKANKRIKITKTHHQSQVLKRNLLFAT